MKTISVITNKFKVKIFLKVLWNWKVTQLMFDIFKLQPKVLMASDLIIV